MVFLDISILDLGPAWNGARGSVWSLGDVSAQKAGPVSVVISVLPKKLTSVLAARF